MEYVHISLFSVANNNGGYQFMMVGSKRSEMGVTVSDCTVCAPRVRFIATVAEMISELQLLNFPRSRIAFYLGVLRHFGSACFELNKAQADKIGMMAPAPVLLDACKREDCHK